MAVTSGQPDLWALVQGTPSIDPERLLMAIEQECRTAAPDFRTRLLLRDAFNALQRRWGNERLNTRISSPARAVIDRITAEGLGDPGFPSLDKRMADATHAETILEFLRELGGALHEPARLEVGGSGSLILAGLIQRQTEDIDAVDAIPAPLQIEHALLDRLVTRYGLRLTHFQSHYLPAGWADRLRSLGVFGKLAVLLVDPMDIFVGKLFSAREKDRDDLRMLKRKLSKQSIVDRFLSSGKALARDVKLRSQAELNWGILWGEALPRPAAD